MIMPYHLADTDQCFGQICYFVFTLKVVALQSRRLHAGISRMKLLNVTQSAQSVFYLAYEVYFSWLLTLRKELRLRVFENRVLRRVLGPRKDEVTGEWRKLQNEELRDLYSLPKIVQVVKSRRMRWAGHVAHMGEGRGVCRVLVGET